LVTQRIKIFIFVAVHAILIHPTVRSTWRRHKLPPENPKLKSDFNNTIKRVCCAVRAQGVLWHGKKEFLDR
jgi:hypothetical protein